MSGLICDGDLIEFRIRRAEPKARTTFVVEVRHNMEAHPPQTFDVAEKARCHVFLAWNRAASLGATVTIRDEVE